MPFKAEKPGLRQIRITNWELAEGPSMGRYVKSRRGPAAGQKAAMYPFLVYPSSPAALARRALDREGVVLQRVLIADA